MAPFASALATADMRVGPGVRCPGGGSISIEHLVFTAERPAFRALGLALLAYALSPQQEPFRIALEDHPSEVVQLVFWPNSAAEIDKSLGLKQHVTQIVYRARLPKDNPNYLTFEQLHDDYPREHLPYWRPGSWNVEGGGVVRPGEPVCAHVQGTAPSLVWLGTYLLNLTLEDCNARLAYLYNANPGESMAPGSAELRFVFGDPSNGVQSLPGPDAWRHAEH
jgi:hypothetical protein